MLILATLALALAELQCCRANIGAAWNGFGAIEGTLDKANKAPMRYRVLVPWMIGRIPKPARLTVYLGIKATMLGATLWASNVMFGHWVPLAMFIAATFHFDYWDHYVELLALMAILSGNPVLMGLGAVVWAMSKETFLAILPLALMLGFYGSFAHAMNGALAAALAAGAAVGVRRTQGDAELYCPRWTFLVYNWPDLKAAAERYDPYPFVAVLWTVAGIACLFMPMPEVLAQTRWIVPVYLVAGWTMARVREVRVLLPTALWIAGAMMGAGA